MSFSCVTRLFSVLFLVLFSGCGSTEESPIPPSSASAGPVLTKNGTALALDGQDTFLLEATYFDGMSHWHQSDLDYLKSKGFNAIRILLDTTLCVPACTDYTPDRHRSMFNTDGTLDRTKTERVHELIHAASAVGMVVELAVLTYYSAGRLTTPNARANAITNAVAEYAKHPNTFFDVVNEFDHALPHEWEEPIENIQNYISAARAASSTAFIVASVTGERYFDYDKEGNSTKNTPIAANILADAALTGIDALAVHNIRDKAWHATTGARTHALQSVLASGSRGMPIIFNEENRRGWNVNQEPKENEFLTAVSQAVDAGAALWSFHTDASFDMSNGATMQSQLDHVERSVVDELPKRAQSS